VEGAFEKLLFSADLVQAVLQAAVLNRRWISNVLVV